MTHRGHLSEQRSALAAATRIHAEYVRRVAQGNLDPFDVIDAARSHAEIALRRIPLELLFRSANQFKPMGWDSIQTRLLETLGERVHDDKLDIGWVLDVRAGGRRYYAMREICRPPQQAPWEGFPWCPKPS